MSAGGPRENCALVGVHGVPDASRTLFFGLFSLQHRGQEACGIVVSDGRSVAARRGTGLVSEVFSGRALEGLDGTFGIGHTRYSTTGSSSDRNIQPFQIEHRGRPLAVAHNGNLVNSWSLRRRLEERGTVFQTTMDTEIILHLLVRSRAKTVRERFLDALSRLTGAFSVLLLSPEGIIAARDPWGWRPLSLARLGDGYMVASETCAFDLVGAEYLREIEPGEVLTIGPKGLRSDRLPARRRAHCIFEFIYFARPDSRVFGQSVYLARKRLGERLAEEFPADADMVVPIPDSGNWAALGFAARRGIPFEPAIVRNHYVGRTFIQPVPARRGLNVKIKLNPVREVLAGKRIVVIDDSIVRGSTSTMRIRSLREAGAREIHMGVCCPPIRHPCFYGIDFPSTDELIASKMSVDRIRRTLGLDGLHYLSVEGMLASMELPARDFCTACFTGKYPVKPGAFRGKTQFE